MILCVKQLTMTVLVLPNSPNHLPLEVNMTSLNVNEIIGLTKSHPWSPPWRSICFVCLIFNLLKLLLACWTILPRTYYLPSPTRFMVLYYNLSRSIKFIFVYFPFTVNNPIFTPSPRLNVNLNERKKSKNSFPWRRIKLNEHQRSITSLFSI